MRKSRFSETQIVEILKEGEAGLPDYQANLWYGLVAPGRTPREIIEKLNADIIAKWMDVVKVAGLRMQTRWTIS
jgi:tripartite-type tricarboxylate transporter receptor subunit TctC